MTIFEVGIQKICDFLTLQCTVVKSLVARKVAASNVQQVFQIPFQEQLFQTLWVGETLAKETQMSEMYMDYWSVFVVKC